MAADPIVDIPPSLLAALPLTEQDYRDLEKSWISRQIADVATLVRVADHEGRRLMGQRSRNCAGILFQYIWPGDSQPSNLRLRRDSPDMVQAADGMIKPERKYLSPPGARNRLYIPIGITLEHLAEANLPIVLTEGEKKALALWRLARHETDSLRFIPIAISGAWNWKGVTGKTGSPKGERLDVKGPIPDLDRIEWTSRKVFVVFDANVATNDSVKWARRGIASVLAKRGANVQLVTVPGLPSVNGIDDFLALRGPEDALKLFADAVSGAQLSVTPPTQYQSAPGGMFRTSGREQLQQVQLTNYHAAIVANIQLDDGLETKREFEIRSELHDRVHMFTVPASEFGRMDWVIERMGSAAITFPNQKDHARTAIQSFSLAAEDRCIYTHTGWREIDGRWAYLHTGGAICVVAEPLRANVQLPGALSRYELSPVTGDALKTALRASLKLLDLAPPGISFPLFAATYRAGLGNIDFAVHLVGETGAFKSELAALHQQHFGAAMNRLNLPAAWSSTGNSLEMLAFHAKDSLLVIDDFAPQGNGNDVARYHAAAERVFRAAGNHAGRSRLDSTAKLREPKPPRALILSTGEDVPRGQSIRARLLILEASKGCLNADHLTICQHDAKEGLYAEAMGGFVSSISGNYGKVKAKLGKEVESYRARAMQNAAHARTPEIIANLQAGFTLFLDFCLETGIISVAKHCELADRCWKALCAAADAQAKHQAATEPATRYVELLRSLLVSGRAYLEAQTGGAPDILQSACGWRKEGDDLRPKGDRIGWVDNDAVYIDPTSAFRFVQVAARDMGEALPISQQTLNKRLNERRFLASVDGSRETITVRRVVCGTTKSVLHFFKSTILPVASDADEDTQ